jgi:hypothetical protein
MPRHAVDPANAILNYAHAVLEGQPRQALSAAGFDLAGDFTRATDGSCRLHSLLARAVVSCGVPQRRLEAHAVWLATCLRC